MVLELSEMFALSYVAIAWLLLLAAYVSLPGAFGICVGLSIVALGELVIER